MILERITNNIRIEHLIEILNWVFQLLVLLCWLLGVRRLVLIQNHILFLLHRSLIFLFITFLEIQKAFLSEIFRLFDNLISKSRPRVIFRISLINGEMLSDIFITLKRRQSPIKTIIILVRFVPISPFIMFLRGFIIWARLENLKDDEIVVILFLFDPARQFHEGFVDFSFVQVEVVLIFSGPMSIHRIKLKFLLNQLPLNECSY